MSQPTEAATGKTALEREIDEIALGLIQSDALSWRTIVTDSKAYRALVASLTSAYHLGAREALEKAIARLVEKAFVAEDMALRERSGIKFELNAIANALHKEAQAIRSLLSEHAKVELP